VKKVLDMISFLIYMAIDVGDMGDLLFPRVKAYDGIHINKCWEQQSESKEVVKRVLYRYSNLFCRNPSLGLATKAKGLQGCGPRGILGVTSHTPRSVRKCEGVNPHTPQATPIPDGLPKLQRAI